MRRANVYVVSDLAIVAAVISLWRRHEISDRDFLKTVDTWKDTGIVPIDWCPVDIGVYNESSNMERHKECKIV